MLNGGNSPLNESLCKSCSRWFGALERTLDLAGRALTRILTTQSALKVIAERKRTSTEVEMSYFLPLDTSERHIRLLTVTSHTSEEPLQCALLTVSLASSPKYTALSYAWGDETNATTISINSERTTITTNLDIALRNLWLKEGEDVSVWADSICINQADDTEKESQVRMMGEIYTNGKFLD